MGLRDRFLTPATARAMLSWRLLLGIGAGAVLALAGSPVGVAVGVGIVLYAASVAAAASRPPARTPIDPFTLGEPWRQLVRRAQAADRELRDTVRRTSDGPLRDTLSDIADRVTSGVDEAWAVARRGDEIDDAVRRLDPTGLRSRLAAAERRSAAGSDDDAVAVVGSLRRQLDVANRLRQQSDEAASTLRLTQTQLDELVARASEVQVGAVDTETYRRDVDDLVIRLEALRQAVEEIERT